jgi:CheY-like chemotaxis protein
MPDILASEVARDLGPHRLLGVIRQDQGLAVCAAIHRAQRERRVVKVLAPGKTPGRVMRRFVQQADAMAAAAHPTLPVIFDAGRLPSGGAYLVTEAIAGEAGDAWLQRVGRPGLPEVLAAAIVARVAEASAHLAGMGVVHGELRLDNLRLVPGPEDAARFTIKLVGSDESALRSWRSTARPDAASEIHDLGVLFLELLLGRRPAGSPLGLAAEVPDLSVQLRRLLERMLAKPPASRYRSTDEIVTAVELILGRHRTRLAQLLVVPGGGRIVVTPAESETSDDLTAVAPALAGDDGEHWMTGAWAKMARLGKVARHAIEAAARWHPRAADRTSAPTILIAEDDDDTRQSLVELLEEHGYRVIAARHGREAQEYLRQGQGAECMLMDLWMPEMDGWTLAAEMQEGRLPSVPTIVMTAAEPHWGYPCPTVVRKPFDSHHLLGLVREMSRPAGSASRPPESETPL